MESKLKLIEDSWSNTMFEFARHRETEVYTLVQSDILLETLEEHQLQLQSMSSMGRFVEFFRSRVESWLRTLSSVETVLKLMLGVQRSWSSLEVCLFGRMDL